MYRNIFVPLTGFENDERALEGAFLAGWPFDARILASHVHPEAMQIITAAALGQFGSRMGNQELIHALQKEAVHRSKLATEAFEKFRQSRLSAHAFGSASGGITAAWQLSEGDPIGDTIAESRYNDLVVLGRAPERGAFSTDAIGKILVGCGRPVLLVPNNAIQAVGHTMAIAWKDTAEAARVVTAAMPILSRAKKIFVISVDEVGVERDKPLRSAERLASQLSNHGMKLEILCLSAPPTAAAETLMRKAVDVGADTVIAGAYSHSRMRELVFGGFTRWILNTSTLPVLLQH